MEILIWLHFSFHLFSYKWIWTFQGDRSYHTQGKKEESEKKVKRRKNR